MRLRVVRHAPPAVTGICYGQSDIPVTIPHDEAAERVCGALGGAPFDAIVTSPFERARGLAEAIARRSGKKAPRVDARLSELSFGEWEGRAFEEIETSDSARFSEWMARYTELAAPGGETVSDLDARVRSFVAEVAQARDSSEDGLLVVAHAGIVRALQRLRDGTSWEEEMSKPVPYLGVIEMEIELPHR